MQEFDFTIEHIAGEKNVVADGLSRLLEVDNDSINILLDVDVYNSKIQNDEIPVINDDVDDFLNVISDVQDSNTILDIDIPDDKYQLIKEAHNALTGHQGVDKTLEKLKSLGHIWKYMRNHIKMFIRKCPFCQKSSFSKSKNYTEGYTLSSFNPMDLVCIDTINLNNADIFGNNYIIVMVDAFTRWVELYAAPDLTSLSAARAILSFIGRFGVPSKIHSDQGTQYVNELIFELTKVLGSFQSINIAPYSHESNGIVERVNKEVMKHLRAIIFEKNIINDWSDNLPIVQRIINSSVHESTGYAPSQLVFGDMIDLNRSIFLPPADRPPSTHAEWLEARLLAYDSIISKAKSLQIEINEQKLNKFLNNSNKDLIKFNIGDLVLVDYTTGHNKLLTNRKGPMSIVAKTADNNFYTVRDLTNLKHDQVFHASKLHIYVNDNEHVNPVDIASRDNQLTIIDTILAHRGARKYPKRLKFHVKWVPNNGIESTTWEFYPILKNNVKLHEYLLAHNMKSLIPAAFRGQSASALGGEVCP
jgi:hypothetical protein